MDLVEQALHKQGIDLSLLDVYLAHRDDSTAQHYKSNDPAKLKVPSLDKIVMKLQKIYKLK